jgi:outer membrane protein assembly factor BamD (BamD/ComL family)
MLSTRYITITTALLLVLCQITAVSFAQKGVDIDITPPKEFENRVLRSEKSDQKKFTVPKRFIQNTVTHYNYYFNANNKLKEVLERAKASFKDDYSQLLPFYNYSLDVTAADTTQLDSITYKSQTGIALHDLRNDWIDNLYVLWGASYYLQKKFDSAYLMFQFINYAFAPKEKDGYYVYIGSRMDGNNAFSIATKEKNSLPRKVFSEPPSRNDAFIWQIRNFLAQDLYTEAASLIVTLKSDPVFPKRLYNDLEEMQALWFYKQKMWDSAAAHLSQALGTAVNKQEQARWEYLVAQLYELSGNNKEAEDHYSLAIKHTTDPIMDIYARLFSIRVNKDGGDNYIAKNIETLLKMAKRDKYQDYRDIIYYMAAQMELERNNIDGALALLKKSTQYTSNDPSQRNKAFLQLADLSFENRKYRQASNFYDSLQMGDPALKDLDGIASRKKIANNIAYNLEIVDRQDSLQRIAALPEAERKDFVRKIVKQLRKEQGLKAEENATSGRTASTGTPPPQLFSTNTKGEWYFYNANSRQKGTADFKARWGTRPNQDNWRRSAALSKMIGNPVVVTNNPGDPSVQSAPGGTADEPAELSFDGLYAKLPLTDESLKKSNDSLQNAQFNLGKLYIQEIENCAKGTQTLEQLRTRFPEFPKMDEVLFNLYYCYNKNGETAKAATIKKLMGEKYSNSNFTTIVTTGKNPQSSSATSDATKTYERIYDLFIEGKFEEAIAQKKQADSIYSNNYWTPQLLYIEAIYYVKQREDSAAKLVLNNIINKFAQTPLAAKAATMIDVLNRRQQIEEELRNLVINRPADDTTTRYRQGPIVTISPVVQQQTNTVKPDSLNVAKAPVQQVPVAVVPDTRVLDSLAARPVQRVAPTNYAFTPETPHYVLIVMNKVDRIFVNEAKNAFARHNRDTYYNKQMTAELVDIDDDNRLLLISPFKNAQDAIAYIEQTRPITATQIVPWLKGGKYTFSIITEANLDVLKSSKDVDKYKQFLDKNLPGKF